LLRHLGDEVRCHRLTCRARPGHFRDREIARITARVG
jgi:hypothetical protein